MQARLTIILLIISLLTNIGLTWKVKSFQKSLEQQAHESWKSKTHPSVGAPVGNLKVIGIDGKPMTIPMETPGFKYTVFYVFRPNCGWCKINLPNLKSLVLQSDQRFRIVGLSTTHDGLISYMQKEGLDFPIYVLPEGMAPLTLSVLGTPTTFVISNGKVGTVVASWVGAYDKEFKSEIELLLKIRLPN